MKQGILVAKTVYMTCLKSYLIILDFGTYEIRKYQENLKTAWKISQVPTFPPKMKILSKLVQAY